MKKLQVTIFALAIAAIFIACESRQQNQWEWTFNSDKCRATDDLATALEQDDSTEVHELIANNPCLCTAIDTARGLTFLSMAIHDQDTSAARLLLKERCGINALNRERSTPLIIAAMVCRTPEIVNALIDNGAIVNHYSNQCDSEHSPLFASTTSTEEIAKVLVSHGADVHHRNSRGESALKYAGIYGNISVLKFLIIDCQVQIDSVYGYTIDGQKATLSYSLRRMAFPIGSVFHKKKLELIDYLKIRGIDYSKEPIPKDIRKNFPPEYLAKY